MLYSQATYSPETVALGGATAFTSGPQASYQNPANLMLRTTRQNNMLTLGHLGFGLSEGMYTNNVADEYIAIQDYFSPGSPTAAYDDRERSGFYTHRFSGEQELFSNTSNYDLLLLGMSWQFDNTAFALTLRSRGISTFQQNSGWESPEFTAVDNNLEVLTRQLRHRIVTFHEISLAYAREYELLTGWRKGLSSFYIGINPKLLIGGMYFDGDYDAYYRRNPHFLQTTKSYTAKSVGDYNSVFSPEASPSDITESIAFGLNDGSLIENNGLGAGFDFGLTYVRNLSDDLSLRDGSRERIRKSFAISASLTDVGYIAYSSQSASVHSFYNNSNTEAPEANTAVFTGRLGEFDGYLANDENENVIFESSSQTDEDAYWVQLPTALNMGTALTYFPITLLANASYMINNSGYEQRRLHTNIGAEIRVLRIIPVRGSIAFNTTGNTEYGFGIGVDLSVVELSTAIRIQPSPDTDNLATGFGLAGITIRI